MFHSIFVIVLTICNHTREKYIKNFPKNGKGTQIIMHFLAVAFIRTSNNTFDSVFMSCCLTYYRSLLDCLTS